MAEEHNSPIGERKTCPNPDCQFDKSMPRANFCILCGTLLYARCEDCLADNPMYANFCHYCGANLQELREERGHSPAPTSGPGGLGELEKPDASEDDAKEEKKNKGNVFDIS
ncbi:MAG: zinc ribbon domain-containing protein [Planctomycetota bacterium]